MFRNYPDVLTVRQLAGALHIGINKAYELVNDGTINSKRIGRRILVPKLYLVDYIQRERYNKGSNGGLI
jgi:excisionase family DNA binding protein